MGQILQLFHSIRQTTGQKGVLLDFVLEVQSPNLIAPFFNKLLEKSM
jgi:hypothetical protein